MKTKIAVLVVFVLISGSILAGVPGYVKEFAGSLWPTVSCKYDLGAKHRKWERIYVQKVVADTNPVNASDLPDSVGFSFVYAVDCSVEHLHYTLPPSPGGCLIKYYFISPVKTTNYANYDTLRMAHHYDTTMTMVIVLDRDSGAVHVAAPGEVFVKWQNDSAAIFTGCPPAHKYQGEFIEFNSLPPSPLKMKKGKTK